MVKDSAEFYDLFAAQYHLIVEDWESEIRRTGEALAPFLPPCEASGSILDCACGIGTQALALASLGYRVDGSDLSPRAVDRILTEAAHRGLSIRVWVDDMRSLAKAPSADYQAVLCMGNSLAHLEDEADLCATFRAIHDRTRPGGKILLGFRDYRPYRGPGCHTMPAPVVYSTGAKRRIFLQVWDWLDEYNYLNHVFISQEQGGAWEDLHIVSPFRVHLPEEVAALAEATGYREIQVLFSGPPGWEMITIVGTKPI
jgi:SAM-dependent methyltransferase